MHYYKLSPSKSPVDAVSLFWEDVESWAKSTMKAATEAKLHSVPEQANFYTGWMPVLRRQEKHPGVAFLASEMNRIVDHFHRSDQWKKGYWAMQQVDRGTDFFCVFINRLWHYAPWEQTSVSVVLDVAQNLGNWNAFVPGWWNPETGLLRSFYLGTNGVDEEDEHGLNVPQHLRCAELALLAFRMSGEKRYLDWAEAYAQKWADAIIGGEQLPVALGKVGPVYAWEGNEAATYNQYTGETHKEGGPLYRAETFLAYGAIGIFLELWQLSKKSVFSEASEKILDILVTQLPDPDAGAVSAAIRQYRNFTGSKKYDETVLDYVELSFPYCIDILAMEANTRRMELPIGVGKSLDGPAWFENNYPRQHNPILLGLAAEISGNERLACRTLDLARGYFSLARMAFEDGRDEGRSAKTIGSVARGNDRENHAGVVTEVLEPLSELLNIL